jgi:hypothetical protein
MRETAEPRAGDQDFVWPFPGRFRLCLEILTVKLIRFAPDRGE